MPRYENQQKNMVDVIDWGVGDGPLAINCSKRQALAAAIGNFDGVHLGHQKVIAAATVAALRDNLSAAVITFDPHPREFFRRDETPFHLADRQEKNRLLSDLLGQNARRRLSMCALMKRCAQRMPAFLSAIFWWLGSSASIRRE